MRVMIAYPCLNRALRPALIADSTLLLTHTHPLSGPLVHPVCRPRALFGALSAYAIANMQSGLPCCTRACDTDPCVDRCCRC